MFKRYRVGWRHGPLAHLCDNLSGYVFFTRLDFVLGAGQLQELYDQQMSNRREQDRQVKVGERCVPAHHWRPRFGSFDLIMKTDETTPPCFAH